MMRQRLQQILILGALTAAFMVTSSITASAEFGQIQMGVNGMIGPIGAYGVTTALTRLEGVQTVKTDLQLAQSELRIVSGTPLKVTQLRKAVVDAGFTPTWIRFEAAGTLVKQDGTYGIQVSGVEQIILLQPNRHLEKLLERATVGQSIAIVGLIPEGKMTAHIERFDIREKPRIRGTHGVFEPNACVRTEKRVADFYTEAGPVT